MLARWSDEVMDPLTQDDPERTWRGRFVSIAGHWGYEFGRALELEKMRAARACSGTWSRCRGRICTQSKFYFATRTTTASGCGCSRRAGWWKSAFRAPSVSTSRHPRMRTPNPTRACCCAPTKTRLCRSRRQKHAATLAHPGRPSSTAHPGKSGLSTRALSELRHHYPGADNEAFHCGRGHRRIAATATVP